MNVMTSSGSAPRRGPCGEVTRVDLSFCVFPCFAVFGVPKIPRCWGKQHGKCHCHTRFCVPQMLVKDLRAVSPNASRQSTGEMTNRPHFAHIQGAPPNKKRNSPTVLGVSDPYRNSETLLGKEYDFHPRASGSSAVRSPEMQNLLWECFQSVSRFAPELVPEMLDRTRGTFNKYHCYHKHCRPETFLSDLFPAIWYRTVTDINSKRMISVIRCCCHRPLVAQCSVTPATVAATPPCSATPFQTQISVRHLPARGGGGVRHQNF